MTKAPTAGSVKMRLVPPLTLEEAAALQACFLKDTAASIAAVAAPGCAGVAVYTPEGTEALFNELMPPGFRLVRSAAKGWENVSAMPRRTSLQRATPPCA